MNHSFLLTAYASAGGDTKRKLTLQYITINESLKHMSVQKNPDTVSTK